MEKLKAADINWNLKLELKKCETEADHTPEAQAIQAEIDALRLPNAINELQHLIKNSKRELQVLKLLTNSDKAHVMLEAAVDVHYDLAISLYDENTWSEDQWDFYKQFPNDEVRRMLDRLHHITEENDKEHEEEINSKIKQVEQYITELRIKKLKLMVEKQKLMTKKLKQPYLFKCNREMHNCNYKCIPMQ
jgi:hypothetical protein